MAFAQLFSGFAARLFGAAPPAAAVADAELVRMGVEAVVGTVDPRLRAGSGYTARLEPGIACTIAHLRTLAQLSRSSSGTPASPTGTACASALSA